MKLTVFKSDEKIYDLDVSPLLEKKKSVSIGRDESNDIILDNRQISRKHAQLMLVNKQLKLIKKSKLGPVFINGIDLQEHVLQPNDICKLGPYVLKVHDIEQTKDISSINLSKNKIIGNENEQTQEIDLTKNLDDLDGNDRDLDDQKGEKLKKVDEAEDYKDYEDNQDFNLEENLDFDSNMELTTHLDEQIDEQNQEEDSDNNLNMSQDMMESDNDGTQFFKAFYKCILKISGEFAPYDEFEISDQDVKIGRDPAKCDLVINDPDISALHAIIFKKGSQLSIKDLNSSNGTIVNSIRTNQAELKSNDEILLGSTNFKVFVQSDLLLAEQDALMPVSENQEIEVEEIVEEELDLDGEVAGTNLNVSKSSNESLFSKEALQDPEKRKKILIIAVILVGAWTLLPEDEKNQKKIPDKHKESIKKSKKVSEQSLRSSKKEEKESEKKDKKFSEKELKALESSYNLLKTFFRDNKLDDAQREIDEILKIDPSGTYKETLSYKRQIIESYRENAAREEQKRKDEEEKKIAEEVEKLINKTEQAIKDHKLELAQSLVAQILEKDPERPEVVGYKMEINAIIKDEEKKKEEERKKKEERANKVAALRPGQEAFMKKQWYQTITKLNKFLKLSDMDEDLINEAAGLLEKAKIELEKAIKPVLEKARMAYDGEDYKIASSSYMDLLKIDPNQLEALERLDNIKNLLNGRAQRIYREAIIAESLSLFDQAKEKYQEVKQISPPNSEYYMKSDEKLKNFFGDSLE